jgi:hypothetical protein
MSTAFVAVVSVLSLLATAALTIYTAVMANKADNANMPNADQQMTDDIKITSQTEGVVVPVVYGWGMVTGNLIWWEAEKVNVPPNPEHFRVNCWQTICANPVKDDFFYRRLTKPLTGKSWESGRKTYSVFAIFVDEKYSDADKSVLVSMKLNPANSYLGTTVTNGLVEFDTADPELFEQCPYIILNNADSGVAPNTIKWENKDSGLQDLPYATRLKGITSILMGFHIQKDTNMPLNYTMPLDAGVTQLPNFKFLVYRKPIDRYDYSELFTERGNNPAAVYYDLLTNKQSLGALDVSKIDDASFQEASEYWAAKRWCINFVINGVTSLRDMINRMQEWTNSYLVKTLNDKYAIKILKETDQPVCEIDIDAKQIEFTLRRKSWEETFNCFTGNYTPLTPAAKTFSGVPALTTKYADTTNPTTINDYRIPAYRTDVIETITIKNEANILLTGNERMKTVDLTCYVQKEVASERLTQIMKIESFPFASASLVTNMEYYYVRVGDVVTIQSVELGVSAPFRVLNVDYKKIDENKLSFDLLQMREMISDQYYGDLSNRRGEIAQAEYPETLESVTFPAFYGTSNQLTRNFVRDDRSVVHWSVGQLRSGRLEYGTDYTVLNHNRIVLDPVLYEAEIGFNASGTLSIDVFEDLVSEES